MERRKTALLILNEYEKEQTYLNLALKQGLSNLSEGRAFVTEVVYGVVRYRRFLDEIISRYSTVKLKKISIPVKNILRIGFYQIYFMDKVPDFAILNESVKLTERFAYKSKGFVNAILRKGLTRMEEPVSPAVKESFPDELYELFLRQYSTQAEDLMKALNQKLPVALRYNHMRFQSAEEAVKMLDGVTLFGDVIYPDSHSDTVSLIQNGDFSVQSASSQMAVRVLSPNPGENVLDCCSAPGGKTAYIGELMKNEGMVTACELHAHRCELVQKNLQRCGITNATVLQADASTVEFSAGNQQFDRILADVPCSGLGVIGSKPDIKWREFSFADLAVLQYQILNHIKKFLKKDGVLVYSTCTINRDENEQQIERFLLENPEFVLEPFCEEVCGIKYGETGMAAILPNAHTIGFFIAKLKRIKE